MRVLIVTATPGEVAPLVAGLAQVPERQPRMIGYRLADRDVHLLTTGVGMVATAAWCARAMAACRYDLALNVGVCGSFDPSLEPGSVVHVVADRIAELGAEDGDDFLSIHDLGPLGVHEFPFSGGQLVNGDPPANPALERLRAVTGITVNTVHGNERSIASVTERFQPEVESMEGAAFMYACLVHQVPFAQVRGVSNMVERRNRDGWKMDAAIAQVCAAALDILKDA